MGQRFLTDDEKAELEQLNSAIQQAFEARTKWLDAKMVECSDIKVGDDIYDLNTGRRLGKVSCLYRYFNKQNIIYDTSPHCDYEYETSPGCFDNTSRQTTLSFGTREEAAARFETRARLLRF